MSDITGAGFYHNTDAANAPGKPHLWKGRGAGSTEHNRQCRGYGEGSPGASGK